jgi:hypothetical protein
LKNGYEIFTSDKNKIWLPEQGKFYKTKFDDGTFFEYMMKDNIFHLNHGLPDGKIAYYEISESGSVKEAKMPYPISDYTVEIPPNMIVREEITRLPNAWISKKYILKYDRYVILTYDNGGKLFEANIQARAIVNHQDRKFSVVDPSNVKRNDRELILSSKNK